MPDLLTDARKVLEALELISTYSYQNAAPKMAAEGIPYMRRLVAALEKAEPVAWMWQNGETGNCGFLENASRADLDHWERMNTPRKIVAPCYAHLQLGVSAPEEPTIERLTEMAYILRLVPRGDLVPIQILDVLKDQFNAAMLAARPTPESPLDGDAARRSALRAARPK